MNSNRRIRMSMQRFTDIAIAGQQALRGKDLARQLAFPRHRRTQAGHDAHLMSQDLIKWNTLHSTACKAWTVGSSFRLFTTESRGASQSIATQWAHADGATLRE
jgi:hypothetical protein